MCKCTPAIRTPFCGKPGCEAPAPLPQLVELLRKWHSLKGAACFREAADELERMQTRIDQLSMPWSELEKQASSEEGVDSEAWVTRLYKRTLDQQRQLSKLQSRADGLKQELEATRDMLTDARVDLEMLRDALGVSVEPHQTLSERLLEAAEKRGTNVAPIARVTISNGVFLTGELYAPGLPDGVHNLFPVPLTSSGELRPFLEATPPPSAEQREGFFTFAQISYALNRSLYAKTGNLAIEGIIEDLWAALNNGGDHPARAGVTKSAVDLPAWICKHGAEHGGAVVATSCGCARP